MDTRFIQTDFDASASSPAEGSSVFPISAVLMAAGVSARYGEANKLLAEFKGRPLIRHIADRLADIPFMDHLAVVRDPKAAALLPSCFSVVPNDTDDLSVRRTIRLALQSVSENCQGALFCVGDQPMLSESSLLRLCDTFLQDTTRIVSLSFEGKRGNPVLFPRSLFPELLDLAEGEAGRAVVKRHPELITTVEAEDASEMFDVDTVLQLQELIDSTC